MKKIRSLKIEAIISSLIILFSLVIIFVIPIKLGKDFDNTDQVDLKFTQSVSQNLIRDKSEQIKEFESISNSQNTEFKIQYLDLNEDEYNQLEEKFREIEFFESISKSRLVLVNPGYNRALVVIPLTMFLIGIMTFVLLKDLSTRSSKIIISISTVIYFVLVSLILFAIVSIISRFSPVSKELVSVLLFILLQLVVLSLWMIIEFVQYLSDKTDKDLIKKVQDFSRKLDSRYVVVTLLLLILNLPLVITSRDATYLTGFVCSFVLVNIYSQTYLFPQIIVIINSLKDFKWKKKLK